MTDTPNQEPAGEDPEAPDTPDNEPPDDDELEADDDEGHLGESGDAVPDRAS